MMNHFNFWRAALDLAWLSVLVLMFRHFWSHRRSLVDAQDWLKAKGHITQYQLVQEGYSLWPKIEYVYSVHDQDVVGHYLFLDTAHNSPNSKYARYVAYNAALAYRDHLEIDVYYNPNRPDESALDVTMPIKLTVILIVIGTLLVAQVIMIFFHFL
jgi:hypothetical protein